MDLSAGRVNGVGGLLYGGSKGWGQAPEPAAPLRPQTQVLKIPASEVTFLVPWYRVAGLGRVVRSWK